MGHQLSGFLLTLLPTISDCAVWDIRVKFVWLFWARVTPNKESKCRANEYSIKQLQLLSFWH
jgi:hypothetical protein